MRDNEDEIVGKNRKGHLLQEEPGEKKSLSAHTYIELPSIQKPFSSLKKGDDPKFLILQQPPLLVDQQKIGGCRLLSHFVRTLSSSEIL